MNNCNVAVPIYKWMRKKVNLAKSWLLQVKICTYVPTYLNSRIILVVWHIT